MEAIRVLIADDQVVYRGLIRATLEAEPDLEVVAEAGDGLEAVELAAVHRPDVVLMDIRMPRLTGIDAAAELIEAQPDVRVLMLTVSDDASDLCDAIVAGALGYLLKDDAPDEVVSAIRRINKGMTTLSPWMAARLLGRFSSPGAGTATRHIQPTLTAPELNVLRSVSLGASSGVDRQVFDVLVKLHAFPYEERHASFAIGN